MMVRLGTEKNEFRLLKTLNIKHETGNIKVKNFFIDTHILYYCNEPF